MSLQDMNRAKKSQKPEMTNAEGVKTLAGLIVAGLFIWWMWGVMHPPARVIDAAYNTTSVGGDLYTAVKMCDRDCEKAGYPDYDTGDCWEQKNAFGVVTSAWCECECIRYK